MRWSSSSGSYFLLQLLLPWVACAWRRRRLRGRGVKQNIIVSTVMTTRNKSKPFPCKISGPVQVSSTDENSNPDPFSTKFLYTRLMTCFASGDRVPHVQAQELNVFLMNGCRKHRVAVWLCVGAGGIRFVFLGGGSWRRISLNVCYLYLCCKMEARVELSHCQSYFYVI